MEDPGDLIDQMDLRWDENAVGPARRLEIISAAVDRMRKRIDPEYLSTLSLREILETVPEGTLISIDLT